MRQLRLTSVASAPGPVAPVALAFAVTLSHTPQTPISVVKLLPAGWEAIPVPGTGKQMYVNHNNGTHTTTRPPASPGLPIGWAQRVDYHGKVFYVNTKEKTTQLSPPSHAIDKLNGDTPVTDHANHLSSPDHVDPMLLHANLEAKRSNALKIETTKSIAEAALMKKSVRGKPEPATSKDAAFLGTVEGPGEDERPSLGISGQHDTGMRQLSKASHHKSIKIHETKANVKVQVKKQLDDIAAKGGKYVDADFAPPQDVPDKIWLRPDHLRYDGKAFIKAGTSSMLFNDPNPEDAKQGTIGDCWFISSLSVLASYKGGHLLRDIFPGQVEYHQSGAFVVRLCVAGQWQNILIDDQMPCLDGGAWNDKNRCLAFCGTVRQQMWAPFIEKAYAKVCRGYLKLIAGQGGEALSALTGWPCQVFDLDDDDELADSLWEAVVTATAEGSLMIISTNDTNEATGLVPNHAYSLTRVVKVNDHASGVEHRLFQIHNPHGHGEWNGDWSDGDKSWTPEIIAQAHPDADIVDADDGTFWMAWVDIVENFDDVVICKVDHTFHESRVPFTMSNKYDGAAESFELQAEHDCIVNLSFTQLVKRALPDNEDVVDLSFILMQIPDDETGTGVIHPALCKYVESASLSLKGSTMIDEFPLKKGRYLVVPFSFWNKREGGTSKKVTFVALSKEALHIRQHSLNIGQARAALRSYIVDGGQSTSSKNFPVTTYFRSEGHGLLLWEENKSTFDAVEFTLDFPLFDGMWNSRNTCHVKDIVPPGHGKLVVVALSIGLVNDEDAQYSWKYTWGSFRKDKNLIPVDIFADMHCPIVNEFVHKDTRITDPTFNKERKYKHASDLITLANTYDGSHPVLKFTIAHETECAIIMNNPAHNDALASENPELWHAGADKAALDYSFVVLMVGADADAHFASAPINVTGEAETECKLMPGDYAIVPFNFSNKHAGAPPVAVKLEIISTQTVQFTKTTTDHLGYKAALRQYITGHGEMAVNDTDAGVVRATRHDGHATMVWVDNSGDGSMKHVLQFASDDNICNSRGSAKKLDDTVQPHEGQLVVMAQPMDIRLGYDVSHGTGWVIVKQPIKRKNDGPESIHSPISLANVPRV